jgi:hypothetical protein
MKKEIDRRQEITQIQKGEGEGERKGTWLMVEGCCASRPDAAGAGRQRQQREEARQRGGLAAPRGGRFPSASIVRRDRLSTYLFLGKQQARALLTLFYIL